MNTMIDPISIQPVSADRDFRVEDAPASIVTTLYDLIATIQDIVDADEALVVATVRHILGSGRAIWCGNVAPCPRGQ